MTRSDLLIFLRQHALMVQASISETGKPQAAVVGYAVTDSFEIIFDTLESTRKFGNLLANPDLALVVGWDDQTAQIEGRADLPEGEELRRAQECYFAVYPDGRDRLKWPGIRHVRVLPRWIRHTDYRSGEEKVTEFEF